MSMLVQWLQILVPAGILWLTVVFTATRENYPLWNQPNPMVQFVLLLPFLSIIALGVYSVATVLWKTLTFNDCKEAAAELQKDIVEANEFLKKNKVIPDK